MRSIECTVVQPDAAAALKAAAEQLGLPAEDLRLDRIDEGLFHVEALRAPAELEIAIRPDGMRAELARFVPALGDAPQPTRDELLAALQRVGVVHGVLLDEIDALLARAPQGDVQHNVLVARGDHPVRGHDATVRPLWPRPTEEDPTRRVRVVRDGEALLEHEPADPGLPGRDVRGKELPPPPVRDAALPDDLHLVADEERRVFRAKVPVFGLLELAEDGLPRVRPGVQVASDRMSAMLHYAAPGADEPLLTEAELRAAVGAAGVVHGLLGAALDRDLPRMIAESPDTARLLVAEGTPPVSGRDAGLHLPPPKPPEPAGPEGRIDHFERGRVVNAEPGELIGMWRPSSGGRDGFGVDGAPIPARGGKPRACRPGPGVRLQELGNDRLAIYAERAGVVYSGPDGDVDVVDLLVVDGDLDLAYGHVDARSSVRVRGTVRSGLRLRVAHDLVVDDSIEDALVEVGGDVHVEHGLLGGASGRVEAAGEVYVGFAQNGRILAEGDVTIGGSAVSTVVECRGRLRTSGAGRLRGGSYCAMQGLEARELGSGYGAPTLVTVGTDPRAARELAVVRAELDQRQARLAKIQRTMPCSGAKNLRGSPNAAQARAFRLAMKARRELSASMQPLRRRAAEIERRLYTHEAPTVAIQEHVHGGVEIRIHAARHVAASTKGPVRFYLDESDGAVATR